jgi:uncharacterized protein YndB with AHSA1/START domain
MASIRKEVTIDARPQDVWDAIRDWGALHERFVPGFVTDARVDGEARIVTFFTGDVLTERIVAVDDRQRRLVWSIVDGPYSHHNGSAQVLDEPGGQARFVWVADVLPHETAERTEQMMERGSQVAKQTLEAARIDSTRAPDSG